MDIHFLYYEDCPSHEKALERLRSIMAEVGVESDIRITKVETDEEAQQYRFVGSPTILINGEDIVPPPDEAPYNLTCRVYRLESGRFSPLPPPEDIRQALVQATQSN